MEHFHPVGVHHDDCRRSEYGRESDGQDTKRAYGKPIALATGSDRDRHRRRGIEIATGWGYGRCCET
jgi:hypothetical protein